MSSLLFAPKNLSELQSALQGQAQVDFVAGGTDWMIAQHSRIKPMPCCISLMEVEEMRGIRLSPDGTSLLIGAAEPLSKVASHPLVLQHAQALAQASASVGSAQIRSRATLGGNLANASPAADTPIALAALGATVCHYRAGATKVVPVTEIITGISENCLENGECLTEFQIPLSPARSAFTKVGSRKEVSIARLNLAASVQTERGSIVSARVYVGTLGTPFRAEQAESALCDCRLDNKQPFLDALTRCVEERIPGRYSLPYKHIAIRGLGDDLLQMLFEGGC